jgi:hypothetical protein
MPITILGVCLLMSLACDRDRKWDFECTAAWSQGGVEVSRKVYTYPQMADEHAATKRCKDEMLESKPKRANSAVCHCIGQE